VIQHTKLVGASERGIDYRAAERAIQEFHDRTNNLYSVLSMEYDADLMDGRDDRLGIVVSGRPRVEHSVETWAS